MDYKTLTDEQLQIERQNIMDEIARRNDLADIPKQAEEMALRFEALGGSKADLAQIVNDATEKIATPEPEAKTHAEFSTPETAKDTSEPL